MSAGSGCLGDRHLGTCKTLKGSCLGGICHRIEDGNCLRNETSCLGGS